MSDKEDFQYGDTVYWVKYKIFGEVAREHGHVRDGLPFGLQIIFNVHRGLVIKVRPNCGGVDVYGLGVLNNLQNAQVYDSYDAAERAARSQLTNIEAVEDKKGERDE